MKFPPLNQFFSLLERKIYKALHRRGISIAPLYSSVAPGASRIPNVVYQTWKYPVVSAVHAREIRRFRRRNFDFSFEFFDDARMSSYMETTYADHPILAVFREIQIPAARADIWRYCLLFERGGMYCDIDSAIQTPLRNLVADDPSEVLSFEGGRYSDLLQVGTYADASLFRVAPPESVMPRLKQPDHTVLNWFLAFEPRHPLLKITLDLIVRNYAFAKGKVFESVWAGVVHTTGPLILTQAVWAWVESTGKTPHQLDIDFDGAGIFKLPGSADGYDVSPHYYSMTSRTLG